MDGREAMALSGGPASYYIPRGGLGAGSGSQPPGLHNPAGFRPLLNPNNIPSQGNVRSSPVGPSFSVEQPSSAPPQQHQQRAVGFPRMGGVSPGMPSSEPVKKKRGRPRKYGPDGPVSLRLSSMSGSQSLTPGSGSPTPKRSRGRPPGSGRKQQLANLGEWMNSSAGIAFAPHVITVGIGEDIVAKLLAFAQQRPRALCILSGSGVVSAVTLRQPASTGVSVTYEGRFQILCLSGSYLVAEDGGPRNRTGGVSVSLCSPDGHVVGGGVAVLTAASAVQVVVCSFVHGNAKVSKSKQIAGPRSEDSSEPPLSSDNLATPTSAPPSHSQSQSQGQSQSQSQSHGYNPSGAGMWPGPRQVELRGPHTGIDLTRG